ncbi:MAG: uroporphyrinogen-III C-methyltransferase [Pseudomonadales bacterium]
MSQADQPSTDTPDPLPEVEAPDASDAAPPKRRGGALAALALLLALAALGGAGYLYYELIHLDQGQAREQAQVLASRLAEIEAQRRSLAQRVDELETRLVDERQSLAQFRQAQEAAREETEQALRASLNAVANQAPPDSGEWRRAEVHYLLRIANHRLLLERDVPGALRLLKAAEVILADLDDFAMFDVRARLTDEIAALEGVEDGDLQGLFLRLEALKRQIDTLPLRVPLFARGPAQPEADAPAPAAGWWAALANQIGSYLRVRRIDDPVKPLLAPEEAGFLEMNLRLMLERAQLAALRRDQVLYEDAVGGAIDWIDEYLDLEKPPVAKLRDELIELQGIELAQPLPDISASLNAMRALSRPGE